ncbi:type 1 fimbrial protein [Shimwellia pseudoproteus]|uniref:fimbrial protein n=1 Tax=Shimwellia pseudoproteus TaxID=570012 RepID=UPI0018EC769D|nr:fimbrial protein [Shimwellia pseudoproteus]MBJ3816718.1 type 1 fimbrial protein [Shimwellia pseudoproteus]
MSLTPLLRAILLLAALWSSASWAMCQRGPAATVKLDMTIGRIIVPPDLPVGAVIKSQDWTMPGGGGIAYYCTGNTTFAAKIVVPNAVDTGNKVFSTNVPGIGLRFSRGGKTVNIVYPGEYNTNAGRGTNYSLEGSRFTLEVIKTAQITGSGTLAQGLYTSYDWDSGNNPILETFLSANAITIVSPSCTVLSGKNMNVDIGAIKRTDLKGVGTWAGGTPFNIQLECSGGVSVSGYANINTTFSGNLATGTQPNQGVLINEKTGSAAAKGVGVQVLKDGTPLEFDKKYLIGQLASSQTSTYTLPYTARFYQYLADISSGEVQSHMVFNLTYD